MVTDFIFEPLSVPENDAMHGIELARPNAVTRNTRNATPAETQKLQHGRSPSNPKLCSHPHRTAAELAHTWLLSSRLPQTIDEKRTAEGRAFPYIIVREDIDAYRTLIAENGKLVYRRAVRPTIPYDDHDRPIESSNALRASCSGHSMWCYGTMRLH
ncbi:hypothetical protein Tcan_03747 [Toxocara canis]|uniref:Uncharacterized protein n=1 Tax=Toxocara canis TaxID=6265 RepID=A0A0B2UKI9_TOXCA|nr:hypothetical protein Tcan_03747 [Toxocara canis]